MRLENIVMSLAAIFCVGVLAQQPAATDAKQAKIAELKKALAANKVALKQYAWTETTQISLKGEVKKTEVKECQYGPDGKVQKTTMPGGSPPPNQQADGERKRGGRLKKEVVEKKTGEMKDYMGRVSALVHEYTPPDPQKIQAAQAAGNVAITLSQPVANFTIKNYLKPGDLVTLGFDTGTKSIVSYQVDSYLDKPQEDAVKLAVNFARLPDGTNHVSQSVLDATGKKIGVTVTNSAYKNLTQ